MYLRNCLLFVIALLFTANGITKAQLLRSAGEPAELAISGVTLNSIRIVFKPVSLITIPENPALAEIKYAAPAITIRSIKKAITKRVGDLFVKVSPNPLTVSVTNLKGLPVQEFVFEEDGTISFRLDDQPVLGMGEGGPKPGKGDSWKSKPIEFDRRGRFFDMQPRWQSDAYGTRNPVPMLIGTKGWAVFVASPWVQVNLKDKNRGVLIPWKPTAKDSILQNEKNQRLNNGKGKPPVVAVIPGFYDLFVFDAHEPARLMKAISRITGPSVLPPKWALGYMQSHRTLQNEQQMTAIVDTFRAKQIPVDAVIYLGTGFVTRGWNSKQPSFVPNPEVFNSSLKGFITGMHQRNVKVVLHIVPNDRDQLPSLHGNIPVEQGEIIDSGHIISYWQKHLELMNTGVDAFWPDEGDWFDLFERIKRHQMYYQGPLSIRPNVRPWSLHRNGYLGIARWGGWVWSGDTESSWKTLEGQIAVGINHSLSLSPFWGSDIGGFNSTAETTGELYTRWFQFSAFTPSFRSHGRTWFTRLPWGWGLKDIGPRESGAYPLTSEINNPAIEPIVKKYDELRYRLLPYNYTLAWEARKTGIPLMRAMWLQYPKDKYASGLSDQYLWGKELLIAPVFKNAAVTRGIYLPKGRWFDFWTNQRIAGGKTITRNVNLNIMPIYVPAGAIIPLDPVRQYTGQPVTGPTTLKVYRGADGCFTLYEDDGVSLDYLKGKFTLTRITWNEKYKKLRIAPANDAVISERLFKVELIPGNFIKMVKYAGKPVDVSF